MIWFTSDWHLDHENIITYSNRPFANVREQEAAIVANFFKCVREGDTVYHLGDIAFDEEAVDRFATRFMRMYHGSVQFHYIVGNHEKRAMAAIRHMATSVSDMKTIKWGKHSITLCHFLMSSFPRSHYNAWQIFGHHHGVVPTEHLGKRMNVCVELHDYKPVSIEDVRLWMNQQPNNWDYLSKTGQEGENRK